MSVEFEPPRSRGGVTFIQGDNGSGKSSICDAIEFAARSVVSRRMRDGEKSRREARNLSTTHPPGVLMELSDGTSYVRGFVDTAFSGGAQRMKTAAVPGFDNAPVVIRREAVESFWRIPPEFRLDYFWDFLRQPSAQVRSSKDDAVIVEHIAARRDLASARQELDRILPRKYYPGKWVLPTHSASAYSAIIRVLQDVINKYSSRPGPVEKAERDTVRNYVEALTREETLRGPAFSAEAKQERQTAPVQSLFEEIGPRITADFFGIFGQDWVRDIAFMVDESGLVNITLITKGGRLSPDQVLSEAGLDVLSLLIAVEAHIATVAHGQNPVIAFDDVFQSVDSPLRSRVLAHLAKRLAGWQIVFTVHDRLWLEVADQRFREQKFGTRIIELRAGGFGGTPVQLVAHTGLLRDLQSCLANGSSAVVVAGVAGRTLEALAEHLSSLLSVKVVRRERDRYELKDLWFPVKSELDGSQLTAAKQLAEEMTNTQFLRNRVGAHANDWADGLSDAEAFDAADQVVRLAAHFRCSNCGGWGRRVGVHGSWNIVFKCCSPSAPQASSS